MSDFGQSTPDGERVQFSRDGAAHVVLERRDTGAGRTHCNRRWLRNDQPREADPDARTCVPCRRSCFGQPRRQHKTVALRNPHSDQAARRQRRRKKKKASRTRAMMERAFRKAGRKEPPPEETEDQTEKEERPGFGRFLRGMLPKFLKRGRGG